MSTRCASSSRDRPAATPPSRRAILTRSVVAIPDVLEDPDYAIGDSAHVGGFRSVLAVPLLREGSADRRHRRRPGRTRAVPRQRRSRCSRPSPTRRSSRSRTCGCSRNWRRGPRELTRSVGELKALGEVGQAVSSTLDLETVLSHDRLARHRSLPAWTAAPSTSTTKRARSSTCTRPTGCPDELVDALRATPIRKGEGALGRLAVTGEPVRDPRHRGRRHLPEPGPRDPHPAGLSIAAGGAAAARGPPARRAGREPEDAPANSRRR